MLKYTLIFGFWFLISCVATSAQVLTRGKLSGVIMDAGSDEPLSSVSIRTKNNSRGTASGASGHFAIELTGLSSDDTLSISHVGYRTFRLPLAQASSQEVTIRLTKEVIVLNEVAVYSAFWLKRYTPEQLNEDYRKFYTLMEKVHTGLFDYMTEREWAALKDSSQQLFKNSMTHSAFYQLIAWHVGKIRNVHTRHGVTDSWYKKKQDIFPFNVRFFGDRLYISECFLADRPFPKGTEVLRINGKTPSEIRSIVWPFIPADGYSQTAKATALNDYFPWYFSLFVEEAEEYNIRLKMQSGEEVDYTSPGFNSSFGALSFSQVWKRKRSALELKIDHQLNAAYFRIDDSNVFKDSLSTYFERIQKNNVQSLVIDLRGEGGIRQKDHVADLYSYLVTKPFRIYERMEIKSNDKKLFDKDFTFKPFYRSAKHVESYLDGLVDSGKGYYTWQQKAYEELISPAKINFLGRVYVLVDGRTYAASTDFTSLASKLENVTIIGEETGGGYRSYTGGAEFGLVLPNSQIGIKIPTWKSILGVSEDPTQKGRGVLPDHHVEESLDDFVNDRDAVKEFAWQLIRENK